MQIREILIFGAKNFWRGQIRGKAKIWGQARPMRPCQVLEYASVILSSFNAVYFVAAFIVSPTSAAGVQISPLYLSVVDTALLNVLETLLSLVITLSHYLLTSIEYFNSRWCEDLKTVGMTQPIHPPENSNWLNSQCKMTENRPQTPPQGKIFFEYISPDSSRIITQLLQI